MSALLDAQPALAAHIQQDLEAGCAKNAYTGRPGLTGEQTLRLLVVRQLTGWTYAELAFHVADSATYRAFCRVGALMMTPSKSVLAATLRRVQSATRAMTAALVRSPAAQEIESGRTVRMDATVVPVAIHPPTDSTPLFDAVRVLDRLLQRAERIAEFTAYHQHGSAPNAARSPSSISPRRRRDADRHAIRICSRARRPRRPTRRAL